MPRTVVLILSAMLAAAPADAAKVRRFPKRFLWGTAISAFQSEMGVGAPNDTGTDWWVWVRDPANVASQRVSGDLPEQGPGFYRLFAGDAKLARNKLHNNALRLSIEWSRIFPHTTAGVDISGGFTPAVLAALDALADADAVAHYRSVLGALRRRKIVPMVTLNHFTLPLWVHDPIAIRDALVSVDPLVGAVPPGLEHAAWLDPSIVPSTISPLPLTAL